jgi:hypothetical protein
VIPGIQRDGINLSSNVSISYLDAILGAVVKVNYGEPKILLLFLESYVHKGGSLSLCLKHQLKLQ